MALESSTTSLSTARSLGQKLFEQCMNSPSPFKLLTTSVRSLRSVVEDVELVFDPTRTLGPADHKLLVEVSRSEEILRRTDTALQAYRRSPHEDVDENAISDLKTTLDVQSHKLSLAFQAVTTGETPTRGALDSAAHGRSTSPSGAESSHGRQSSRRSSVWSARDSPSISSASEPPSLRIETRDDHGSVTSDEQPLSAHTPELRIPMDQNISFRSPDLLSMPFDAAVSELTRDDDDLSMSHSARSRSRANSNISELTSTTEVAQRPASSENETEEQSVAGAESQAAVERRHLAVRTSRELGRKPSREAVVESLEPNLGLERRAKVQKASSPSRHRWGVDDESRRSSSAPRKPRSISDVTYLTPYRAGAETTTESRTDVEILATVVLPSANHELDVYPSVEQDDDGSEGARMVARSLEMHGSESEANIKNRSMIEDLNMMMQKAFNQSAVQAETGQTRSSQGVEEAGSIEEKVNVDTQAGDPAGWSASLVDDGRSTRVMPPPATTSHIEDTQAPHLRSPQREIAPELPPRSPPPPPPSARRHSTSRPFPPDPPTSARSLEENPRRLAGPMLGARPRTADTEDMINLAPKRSAAPASREKSRYRIVNQTAPEESESEDEVPSTMQPTTSNFVPDPQSQRPASEDEMYTASRPHSMIRPATLQPEVSETSIPTIHVVESRSEDVSRPSNPLNGQRSKDAPHSSQPPPTLVQSAETMSRDIKQTGPAFPDKDTSAAQSPPSSPTLPRRPVPAKQSLERLQKPLPEAVAKRIEAAIAAADKYSVPKRNLPGESATASPPAVPPRPTTSHFRRPQPLVTHSSPAALPLHLVESAPTEKELVLTTGLEVDQTLQAPEVVSSMDAERQRRYMPPRVSADAALDVNVTPQLVILPSSRHVRAASSSQVDAPTSSIANWRPAPNPAPLEGWYGPTGAAVDVNFDLDFERINHICMHWNSHEWNAAECYLQPFLESLMARNELARARRLRHLLAICASYRGEYRKAITMFLSVLQTPIKDVEDIDAGDSAAFWWLGDCYTMLNKRTEALLAYCAAEYGPTFKRSDESHRLEVIAAEQEIVQLGVSKADFKILWAQQVLNTDTPAADSILHPSVIPADVINLLFGNDSPSARRKQNSKGKAYHLTPGDARGSALGLSRTLIKISASELKYTSAPWPMEYDPFFSITNVHQGRLTLHECDLLTALGAGSDSRLPRSTAINNFTCNDLGWLITTVRACLKRHEMHWSEVSSTDSVCFAVGYPRMQSSAKLSRSNTATMHYFSIALFKQSLRHGYGVDLCPWGVLSSRIIRRDFEHPNGVHEEELKTVKKRIREYLDVAAKTQRKFEKRKSTFRFGTSTATDPDLL